MFWLLNLLVVALLLWDVPRQINRRGFDWLAGLGVFLLVINTYYVGLGIREML